MMMKKKKKRMKRDGRRERIGLVRVGTDADEGEEKIKTRRNKKAPSFEGLSGCLGRSDQLDTSHQVAPASANSNIMNNFLQCRVQMELNLFASIPLPLPLSLAFPSSLHSLHFT